MRSAYVSALPYEGRYICFQMTRNDARFRARFLQISHSFWASDVGRCKHSRWASLPVIIPLTGREITRSPADASIARHASRWLPPKCKTHKFSRTLLWPSSLEFEIWVGFGMQVANLSCYVPISTFVTLCDHDPPTVRTDEQTDDLRAA